MHGDELVKDNNFLFIIVFVKVVQKKPPLRISSKFHNLVYFNPMIIDPRNNRKQKFALCGVSFTG